MGSSSSSSRGMHLNNSCGVWCLSFVWRRRQIRAGAVQRPLVADVRPCDAGPALVPARSLCGAQPAVQLYHEHALNSGNRAGIPPPRRPCRGGGRGDRHSTGKIMEIFFCFVFVVVVVVVHITKQKKETRDPGPSSGRK